MEEWKKARVVAFLKGELPVVIYVLDEDPREAVRCLVDHDVNTQPVDASRIMLTALMVRGVPEDELGDIRPFYTGDVIGMMPPGGHEHPFNINFNDPWVFWAAKTRENYLWLADYAHALWDEAKARYGWEHSSRTRLERLTSRALSERIPRNHPLELPDIGEARRRYVMETDWATWRKPGKEPAWWNER